MIKPENKISKSYENRKICLSPIFTKKWAIFCLKSRKISRKISFVHQQSVAMPHFTQIK